MAIRTNLQPRRKRMDLGIIRGKPLTKLRKREKKIKLIKQGINRDRKLIEKILKDKALQGSMSNKAFERAVKSGVSQGGSGRGVTVDFKKRKKRKKK